MRRRWLFIAGLMLVFGTPFSQSGSAQNVSKRELKHYDDGGTFDFNWGLGPGAHERMRPKLREYLWAHWSQKKLGHVVATFYSIEGDPTTHHLYVEPDQAGRWRVVSEYESECCWFYSMEKKKRKRERRKGVEIYDTVERIEESGDRFYIRLRNAGGINVTVDFII